MPRLFSTILVLLCALCIASGAMAETIWSGLVMANNVPQPTPIPAELSRLEGTLKNLFGYNQFQVIGQSRKTIQTGEEDWLATSKYFSLKVDSRSPGTAGAYLLNLQLLQENKLLLETEARLTKQSPLVIKGPLIGEGQLILILVVE